MLLKNKIFTTLVTLSLLVFFLTSLTSSIPIAGDGDKLTAVFKALEGTITFEQIDPSNVKGSGQFNAGITDSNADNYSIEVLGVSKTFTQLGIKIIPPGTAPYSNSAPGNVVFLKDQVITVSHEGTVIDSTTIS